MLLGQGLNEHCIQGEGAEASYICPFILEIFFIHVFIISALEYDAKHKCYTSCIFLPPHFDFTIEQSVQIIHLFGNSV